ncbi:UDP-N-acetylglucosamine 2-epimerase (hydrolyzing) [Campylobacter sp. RM12642]|uniref:UDP-N-acetylglucosamine 2-epimerase n=1 Tax=unclassified Campylobacter TaxID=2593542 RepID=UPI001D1C0801|nr:UDP-N-acetylglucosamine 2-epimerase (hydrolyzing) [Campylobacter sp. RM12642]MBZ8007753.1 UDP-N-acetylglucosamine 2-epimerase (hydrolyzing) [Campylobacter sp. RM9334]
MSKKILFVSGTRADWGKIKPLIEKIQKDNSLNYMIYACGMHLLEQFGSTYKEIIKDGFSNLYLAKKYKTNKTDINLSHFISDFSEFVSSYKPDMIVIHGDRPEALGGAIVGAFNNILVAHIEGGEKSGTIDDSIRHSVTKLSHIHFVANDEAKARLIQLGEDEKTIFVIGSADIDVMLSDNLPNLDDVKSYYNIEFKDYAIFSFHPVTTEVHSMQYQIENLIQLLINSNKNYICIYPNNDLGSDIILNELKKLKTNSKFKLFPSIKFEKFLTLLKYAEFIIGNSSAGIREARVYGTYCINIGSRQNSRVKENIKYIKTFKSDDMQLLDFIKTHNFNIKNKDNSFSSGNCAGEFLKILNNKKTWKINLQKRFNDL